MKQFTKYSMFRGFGKFIGVSIILFLLALTAGVFVESYKADHSTGLAKVEHTFNSDFCKLVLVAAFVLPAIHSLRITSSLGLMKQRVWAPELGLYLTHAELAIHNFITKSKDVTSQLRKDYGDGNLRIQTFADSIKCIITSQTGNKEVFMASAATYRQGRIPEIFNQAELPEGTVIALSHIALAYATDASATVPEADVDFSRVVTAWPAALANAEMLILQNGIKQRFMCKAAGSQGNSLQSAIESDGLEFNSPVILQEKKQIKIEVRYAEGQSISGTNNHFLDICMMGAIITRKS